LEIAQPFAWICRAYDKPIAHDAVLTNIIDKNTKEQKLFEKVSEEQ